MKKVLFKASSPFVSLTAIIIAQVYYSDAYKILVINQRLYEGYEKKIVELHLFDEVYFMSHANMQVAYIEDTVDGLLQKHPDIDEYFMNTFSDCFSLMFAYRLLGKAKLHIFPEGSSTIQLQKVLELIQRKSEVTSKDPDRRRFFLKYPIDLSIFDYTWLYDLNIPQGNFRAEKMHICLKELFDKENANDIIDRMNILFSYEDVKDFDICLLDSFEPQDDYMDYQAESTILHVLMLSLVGKKVLVKPHPPKDRMFPYAKFKFREYNVEILKNADIPWELMLINLIRNGRKEVTIITLDLCGTCNMTSMAMIPDDFHLNIIAVSQLEEAHMSEYMGLLHHLCYDYFIHAAMKKNISLFIPQNFSDIAQIGEKITGKLALIDQYSEPVPNSLFSKIGNLLEKSVLYDSEQTFFEEAYYHFYDEMSTIVFDVNKQINISEINWRPSVNRLFCFVSNLTVKIVGERDVEKEYSICGSDENIYFEEGLTKLKLSYAGFCKSVIFYGKFTVYRKFCRMYEEVYNNQWNKDFWEEWYDIVKENMLIKYLRKKDIKAIWLYGWNKNSIAIADELRHCDVQYMFVSTKGKGSFNDGRTDIAIADAFQKYSAPDLIVIAPMFAYDSIIFSMPKKLIPYAVSLNEFINRVKDSQKDD